LFGPSCQASFIRGRPRSTTQGGGKRTSPKPRTSDGCAKSISFGKTCSRWWWSRQGPRVSPAKRLQEFRQAGCAHDALFRRHLNPVTRLLRTAVPNTPAGRLASELQTDARLLGVTSPGLPWACEVSSCSADQGAAAVTVADTQSKHALGQRPLQSEWPISRFFTLRLRVRLMGWERRGLSQLLSQSFGWKTGLEMKTLNRALRSKIPRWSHGNPDTLSRVRHTLHQEAVLVWLQPTANRLKRVRRTSNPLVPELGYAVFECEAR